MKTTSARKIFLNVNNIFLAVLGFSTIFPFLYLAFVSIIPKEQYAMIGLAWPKHLSFETYALFFRDGSPMLAGYKITLIATVATTVLSVIITALMAYALSKKEMPGRNVMNFLLFFTMLFSGGLIPWYLTVKGLGLTNNLWAIIIPFLCTPMNVFIMRTFFSSMPKELEESAYIDGASELRIMITIIMPLSLPVIATISLFVAVGAWNEWFHASFLISDKNLFPLQLALRKILISTDSAIASTSSLSGDRYNPPPGDLVRSAAVMLTTLPILVTYPFAQKYFVKGVMLGSIKG